MDLTKVPKQLCENISVAFTQEYFVMLMLVGDVAPASRVGVGMAHATISIIPGVITWFLVATIEAAANRGRWPAGLMLPALSALLYISVVSWAAALPFSRYASGVVWLLLAIVLAGAGKLLALREAYAAGSETWTDAWKAAGAALVFPPLIVSEPFAPAAMTVLVILGAAGLAFAIALAFITTIDLPLVDPS